jgi:crotonobetainyl-CoA:carnitine CoA-transferase CaiB-like acyl-CoA transferase
MPEQPLAGIRVLELAEGVQGPYAGKLLADFGADVVKAEPPTGDRARPAGPFPDDRPDPEQSALFLHLNTNKRSITLDPTDPEGRDLLRRLVADVDVVIESYAPGTLEGWGLGFPALRALQPRIVLTSVTPFGQDGPYAGYAGEEIVYYAMGGPMRATGVAGREPLKLSGAVTGYQCGSVAATATLAALATGEAVHVDVSNFESQAGSIDRRLSALVNYAYNGDESTREAPPTSMPLPRSIYPVADGYVQVMTTPRWVPRMLATLGDDELAAAYARPGWQVDPHLSEHLDAVLRPWLLARTKDRAMAEAQANGWPITALNTPVDVLQVDHFRQRGTFVTVEHPCTGGHEQLGPPFRMEDGWQLRRPAPLLGQHTEEVLEELASARPTGRATGPATVGAGAGALPLAGLRVLDLSVVWSGPYCTMLLSDLGAEVVRLDNPWLFPSSTKGQMPRPPKELAERLGGLVAAYPDHDPGPRPWNRHAMFNCHARGKLIATLDLRRPSGRETFLRLVERSDVLVENNSAHTLDSLDLGWDVLAARNPRLVAVRMAPFGLSGPLRDVIGFGANFEAFVGLTATRGYGDADPTTTSAVFHMDPATGVTATFGILAALRARERTGRGQLIEFPQAENVMQHIGELVVDAARTGRVHGPLGNRHPTRAPQGAYPCRGDDRWLAVSVGSDEEWAGLRRAMGDPAWAGDERYATAAGRRACHDEIDRGIAAWTRDGDDIELFHRCQAEGVPAGPVLHEHDLYADPHLRARGFFRANTAVDAGTHEYPAHLWHWTGPELRWAPIAAMGDHNDYVYREVLGLSDEEYAALEADGHISRDYLDSDGNPL